MSRYGLHNNAIECRKCSFLKSVNNELQILGLSLSVLPVSFAHHKCSPFLTTCILIALLYLVSLVIIYSNLFCTFFIAFVEHIAYYHRLVTLACYFVIVINFTSVASTTGHRYLLRKVFVACHTTLTRTHMHSFYINQIRKHIHTFVTLIVKSCWPPQILAIQAYSKGFYISLYQLMSLNTISS